MKNQLKAAMATGLLLSAGTATALDTTEPFLCAVTQVTECLDGFGCESVLPEMVGAPTFIWVDMKKNRIRTNQNADGSRIANKAVIDGRHILQGAEDGDPEATDGAGWTLSIEDSTGRFAAAVAIEQATLSMFGSCTELP
jgi:hypothetical protein